MKKIFYYLRAFSISILCGAGVSLGFIFSQDAADFLASSLKLKVNPSMNGGIPAEEFFDGFSNDSMVRYKVYNPVYDGVWQINPDYWQIEETFDKKIADFSSIVTFIADDSGNRYSVIYSDGSAGLFDSERNFITDCEIYFSDEEKNIKIRIPIINDRLRKLYTAKTTYHRILADGNEAAAFQVKMGTKAEKDSIEEKIAEIRKDYGKMIEAMKKNGDAAAENDFDAAKILFNKGKTDEAADAFKKIMDNDGENGPFYAQSMAYYGSCVAIKAGKANMFQAMKLVNESFIWLDKAVLLSEGKPFEIDVLMNRGEVASSVPNGVFHKASTGAGDFEKSGELFQKFSEGKILSEEDRLFLAYLYASAADCRLKCGMESQAKIDMRKAVKFLGED